MIEALKKYKKAIIVIVVIIVAFVGYSLFSGGDNGGNVLTSQNPSAQTAGDNELLILLINLRSITLNESLFNDSAFKSLVDFGQQLIPEPIGRRNPFAPVGSDDI